MQRSDSFFTNKKRQIKLSNLKNMLRNDISLNFSIPLKNQEISNAEEIIPIVRIIYMSLYSLHNNKKINQTTEEP